MIVLPLDAPLTGVGEAEVGGKAINLMRMIQAGMRVPEGLVLTVDFFTPWFERLGQLEAWRALSEGSELELREACEQLRGEALAFELDHERREAIADALAGFAPEDRFCVRSSSPREDLEGSSFAGIYETVLGLRRAEIERGIREVFASCLDRRVALYERQRGRSAEPPRIAAIVQRQLDSDKAGVGFSINPLTNDHDEASFSANWGQGETVVSGLASPDLFVVAKPSLEIRERSLGGKELSITLDPEGGTVEGRDPRHAALCLNDDEIVELSRALIQVEDHYGRPMDIEWAYAEGRLYLVQARPITTYHPLAEELRTPAGAPRRLYVDVTMSVQGIFEPLSPLGMSLFRVVIPAVLGEMIGADHMPPARRCVMIPASTGRLYADLANIRGLLGDGRLMAALGQLDGLVQAAVAELDLDDYAEGELRRPPIVLAALLRAHRRLPQLIRALRRPQDALARWRGRWAEHQAALDELDARGLPFTEYVDAVVTRVVRLVLREVVPLFPSAKIALARIRRLFPDPDAETRKLLERLDQSLPGNVTVEMGHALYGLARDVDPDLYADADALARALGLGHVGDELRAAWSDFLARYGHRGVKEIDLAAPRYREQPELLLGQVLELARRGAEAGSPAAQQEAARRRRDAAAEELAARLSGRRRARFWAMREVVETLGGLRETHKFVFVHSVDRIRRRVLEEGAKLDGQGRLAAPEQVFWLALDELERGLADGEFDLAARVEAGQARRARDGQCRQAWPLIDSRGRFHRPKPRAAATGELVGNGVSSGVATGPVKVLHHPDEKPLLHGEVLVARATDPAWTPLFVNAAAIVLEIGGPLQHGALVAREYGKPCVCGLEAATERLHDGEQVEVDGDAGRVRRLDRDEAEP